MGQHNKQRRRAKAKTRRTRGPTPGAAQRATPDAGPPPSGAAHWFTPEGSVPPPSEADEAAALVADALRAVALGHPGPVESARADLLDFSATTRRQKMTSRVILDCLHAYLTLAWQHGWQPADLLRLAGRGLDRLEVAILGDAVVADLDRYAAATVDPRWAGQLREAGATRWWSGDTDPLLARAAVSQGGWAAVCTAALAVVDLCAGLPVLEVIGPRPGEAVPSRDTARDRPEVDERILSRVRQLLAKAESTTYEAEAETFTAGAQALMARHSIDSAMLQAASRDSWAPEARRIGLDRPYEPAKAMLLDAVAQANRCRMVWSQTLGFATVLGFATDLEAVETLFTSLLVQATHAVTREGTRRTTSGRSRTRSFRSSFLTSYAARIGERLSEVTQSETESATARSDESSADPAARHTAGELVRVLAARSGEVDEAVDAMFPEVVSRGVSQPQDLEGWASGRAAADRAALGSRDRVAAAPQARTG